MNLKQVVEETDQYLNSCHYQQPKVSRSASKTNSLTFYLHYAYHHHLHTRLQKIRSMVQKHSIHTKQEASN